MKDDDLDMQPRKITEEHRANLKASWTEERKQQASAARLGKPRGEYRKDE